MKKKNRYTFDFETSTLNWYLKDGYARVWAYSICEIGNPSNFIHGTNIDDFMKWCMNTKQNYICYGHNLKFDGEYIFHWLLKNGYECIEDKKARKDKSFTCLLSDTGLFYSIEVYFTVKDNKIIEVKKDISEIQSILDPVWNKQSQKVEEYDAKMSEIKSKMDKLQSEYSSNLQ